jgi:hypothetical protein
MAARISPLLGGEIKSKNNAPFDPMQIESFDTLWRRRSISLSDSQLF